MKFTGPLGKSFKGDRAKAMSLMGPVRLLVQQLIDEIKRPPRNGYGQEVRTRRLPSGDVIGAYVQMLGAAPIIRTWVESPVFSYSNNPSTVLFPATATSIAFIPVYIDSWIPYVYTENTNCSEWAATNNELTWKVYGPNTTDSAALGAATSDSAHLIGFIRPWQTTKPENSAWHVTGTNPLVVESGKPTAFGSMYWAENDVVLGKGGWGVVSWFAPYSRAWNIRDGLSGLGKLIDVAAFNSCLDVCFSGVIYHKFSELVTHTNTASSSRFIIGAGIETSEDKTGGRINYGCIFRELVNGNYSYKIEFWSAKLKLAETNDKYVLDGGSVLSSRYSLYETITPFFSSGTNSISSIMSGLYFSGDGKKAVLTFKARYGYDRRHNSIMMPSHLMHVVFSDGNTQTSIEPLYDSSIEEPSLVITETNESDGAVTQLDSTYVGGQDGTKKEWETSEHYIESLWVERDYCLLADYVKDELVYLRIKTPSAVDTYRKTVRTDSELRTSFYSSAVPAEWVILSNTTEANVAQDKIYTIYSTDGELSLDVKQSKQNFTHNTQNEFRKDSWDASEIVTGVYEQESSNVVINVTALHVDIRTHTVVFRQERYRDTYVNSSSGGYVQILNNVDYSLFGYAGTDISPINLGDYEPNAFEYGDGVFSAPGWLYAPSGQPVCDLYGPFFLLHASTVQIDGCYALSLCLLDRSAGRVISIDRFTGLGSARAAFKQSDARYIPASMTLV